MEDAELEANVQELCGSATTPHENPMLAMTSDAPERDQGVTGVERQRLEGELEATLRRLTTDLSELAMTRLLPKAKAMYEQLHPETRHGGPRPTRKKQDAKFSTCCFARHVADTRGISQRTVHNRLADAERLTTLDEEAAIACFGTALANQVKLVIRIAAIPDPALQRDLVVLYDRVRSQAKADLEKYEEKFGLSCSPAPAKGDDENQTDDEQGEEPDEAAGSAGLDDEQQAAAINLDSPDQESAPDTGLAIIMQALGVTTVNDCLQAIQELKASQMQVYDLRAQLHHMEAANEQLKRDLAVYENAPIGQLFSLLDAKTAGDALAKARALRELTNAA